MSRSAGWLANPAFRTVIASALGYVFPIDAKYQGYLNLKAYGEFDNANRADGWNVWLTFVISPAAPAPSMPSRSLITK